MNKLILILMAALTAMPVFADESILITYLGTNDYVMSNSYAVEQSAYQFESYNLDDLSNLENEITKELPADREEAQRIANKRMELINESNSIQIFKGVARLIQWDIKKLPAFVFGDGEYVIYGVSDADIAIKRFVNSRKR